MGVDGITKEEYGRALRLRLPDLHARLRSQQWRHQPIRRVNIPKEPGKTRPIGVSTIEDKIVQDAVREVLEIVYEQEFLDCSHGFRPKRKAHDALRALDRAVYRGEVEWILEADITAFFDSMDRNQLMFENSHPRGHSRSSIPLKGTIAIPSDWRIPRMARAGRR